MKRPIFDAQDGYARSLMSNRTQPTMKDNHIDNITGNRVYTAVIEIYEDADKY